MRQLHLTQSARHSKAGNLIMPRFLIEVPHDPTPRACTRAVEVLLRTGSHFLTHAEWGCKDNVHKAWIIMDFDSREAALNNVPADFRGAATVVQLNRFVLDEQGKVRSSALDAHQG
jgi:hypothetical protein